jgi:hypothetical protein
MTEVAANDLAVISERIVDALTRLDRPFGCFLVDHNDVYDTRMAYISESRLRLKVAHVRHELEALANFFGPEVTDAKGAALVFHRNGICSPTLIGVAAPVQAKAATPGTAEYDAIQEEIAANGHVTGPVELRVTYWDITAGRLIAPDYTDGTWKVLDVECDEPWMAEQCKKLADNYAATAEALKADLEMASKGIIATDDIEYADALKTAVSGQNPNDDSLSVAPRMVMTSIATAAGMLRTPAVVYMARGDWYTVILDESDMPAFTSSVIKVLVKSGDEHARRALRAIKDLLNSPIISLLLSKPDTVKLTADQMEQLRKDIFGTTDIKHVDLVTENEDAEAQPA